MQDVDHDQHGIITATIPATISGPVPVIAFNAHLDTSPETSGHNVQPCVHKDYNGQDIVLSKDPTKVLRMADNPDLARLKGKTIITTDGTTLLGGDDKAGVAVIMEMAAYLMAHRNLEHGTIRICFTCDEEIGHGVDHIDLKRLGAQVAYTLDGSGQGEIDVETFSADLAVVAITGVNIHPSIAKGRMVNAVRLAGMFLDRLPKQLLAPEVTSEREGFLHPYRIEGGVGEVTMRILLRDFDTPKLAEQAELLRSTARLLMTDYPQAKVEVRVAPQYRNMADGLTKEPRAVAFAEEAMRRAGLAPKRTIVRGGTDGSRLTEMGLPTPNLSTGEHNIHSPLEWTCLEEMQTAVRVLVELCKVWANG
jgi:tripeptide aminopeptidase